jgi:hypothetical protein
MRYVASRLEGFDNDGPRSGLVRRLKAKAVVASATSK